MIYLLEGTVKTESRVMFFVDAISKFDAAQKVRNGKDFLRYQLETKDESHPTNFIFHGTFQPFDESIAERLIDKISMDIHKETFDEDDDE